MSAPVLDVTTQAQSQINADAIEDQPTTPFVAGDVGKGIYYTGTEWAFSDATDAAKGATSVITEISPEGDTAKFRRAKPGDLVTYAPGGLTPGATLYETGTGVGLLGGTVDAAAVIKHSMGEAKTATSYVFEPYIAVS